MGKYSQEDRVFRVDVPSLGDDVLLLEGFSGEEHVSEPFQLTLQMVSEDPAIAPADVLRQPFVVSMRLPDGSDRPIHGLCRRFTQLHQDEDLTSYEAEIVPWLWFLSLNQDCRIFQQKTVPEIIEEVFGKYDQAAFENRCVQNYPPREYCVQYRESDLNLVSRLMEEEGIFYFFEHAGDAHTLVLADDGSALQECPVQAAFRVATSPEAWTDEDVITHLEREHQVYTNKVTLTDYDHLQPSMDLESVASDEDHEEHYDYPGKYTKLADGERYAGLLLEERAAGQDVVRGESRGRAMRSGYTFILEDHYRADTNQTYLLLSAWHVASGGGYRTGEAETEYTNRFECIPASRPYRPPRRAEKPAMKGLQTAVVVGPSGEEVYTEKGARVKVQFHWDREGKGDENSSCWIRVATPWGGKGYGSVSIPRIGNEVVVAFEEGDPDRPLVVGSLYNAEQTPPFGLPGAGIQMGMKSRSSPGGGGMNEITMTDTKGKEVITIHGQYDMNTTVEHDETVDIKNNRTASVGVDESLSVGNDQSESIGNDRTEQVGNNETATIGKDRGTTIGGSDSLTVARNRTHSVAINESVNVGAAQEVTVGGMRTVTVAMNQSTSVGRDLSASVGGDRSASVAKNDSVQVGKKLVINAGDEIVIQTGKASITMKKDGTIQISGKDLTVKGSGKVDVKASKDMTMKAKKILQN